MSDIGAIYSGILRLATNFRNQAMSLSGPERYLLRDSNTSEVAGRADITWTPLN